MGQHDLSECVVMLLRSVCTKERFDHFLSHFLHNAHSHSHTPPVSQTAQTYPLLRKHLVVLVCRWARPHTTPAAMAPKVKRIMTQPIVRHAHDIYACFLLQIAPLTHAPRLHVTTELDLSVLAEQTKDTDMALRST